METSSEHSRGFPRDLLSQPPEARLHYFETKVVAHQRLKEVHASLLHALRYPAGVSLILAVGPTGVGKTTLRRRMERQLGEDAQASPTCSPGHIPVVGLEVPAPDGRNFNWKDYYTRALLALDEPFVADKITYEVCDMHRDEQGRLVIGRSLTIPDLESHADEFYERCLGCTGMLKTWLNRALASALEQQAKTIIRALWQRHAEPRSKLVQMIREIREGEQALAEDEAHYQELRTLLHLPCTDPLENDAAASPQGAPQSQPIPVGQRAPHRDPVGRENPCG